MSRAPTPRNGALVLLGSRVAAYGLSGAGAVVVSRFLGPERVGAVAAATSVVTIMLVLGPFGIDQLYLQGRIDWPTAKRHLWRAAGASSVLAVVGSLLWPGLPAVARLCGVLIGLAAAGDQLKVLWLCTPQRALNFALRGRRDLAMRSLSVLLSVLAAVTIGTAAAIAAGTLAASILVLLPALRQQADASEDVPERPSFREVVRPGLPFAFSSALYALYFQVDGAILASLRSSSEVGLYRAAYSFVFASAAIPVALNGDVLRSRLFRAYEEGGSLWPLSLRFAAASAFLGTFVAVVLVVFAESLVRLLFGSAFAASAALLAILALAIVPHFLNSWAANVLIATGRVRQVLAVQGLLVAVNITGNLAAIPHHGARGAAWMTVVCEGTGAVTYLALIFLNRRLISGGLTTFRAAGSSRPASGR